MLGDGLMFTLNPCKGRQDARITFDSRIPVGRFLIVRLLDRSSRVGSDVHPCTFSPECRLTL